MLAVIGIVIHLVYAALGRRLARWTA